MHGQIKPSQGVIPTKGLWCSVDVYLTSLDFLVIEWCSRFVWQQTLEAGGRADIERKNEMETIFLSKRKVERKALSIF